MGREDRMQKAVLQIEVVWASNSKHHLPSVVRRMTRRKMCRFHCIALWWYYCLCVWNVLPFKVVYNHGKFTTRNYLHWSAEWPYYQSWHTVFQVHLDSWPQLAVYCQWLYHWVHFESYQHNLVLHPTTLHSLALPLRMNVWPAVNTYSLPDLNHYLTLWSSLWGGVYLLPDWACFTQSREIARIGR